LGPDCVRLPDGVSLPQQSGGRAITTRFGLIGTLVLAGLSSAALAQSAVQTKPVFLGGYNPDACRFPPEARRAGLSGCCEMDLEIDANGRVTKIDGVCSDPLFLEPTRRCLSVLGFAPAKRYGRR
jgi:hypothetical protein